MLVQTEREDEQLHNSLAYSHERDGRFVKGGKPGPGRPQGARSRLSEAFFQDLALDWQEGGAETIARVRRDDPSTYLRVVASILPKELNVTVSVLDTMSDDDLMTLLQGLRERRRQTASKTIEGKVEDVR